jgi:hypothetical protein
VNEDVTEFKRASDPDTMTFFQFGILYFYYGWLHRICCAHSSLEAYNTIINIKIFSSMSYFLHVEEFVEDLQV